MSGETPNPGPTPAEEVKRGIDGQPIQPPSAPRATPLTLEGTIWPLGIAAMLGCIAISISRLIASFAPEWPGKVFVGLVFIISLESISAQRLLSRSRVQAQDKFRFRVAEWIVILLLVRFGFYLGYGMERLRTDLAAWMANWVNFFDPAFIVTMLLVFCFWAVALWLSQALQNLEASPIERMPSVTDPGHYLRSTMPRHGLIDRQAHLNHIVSIFFGGGVLLLLLTGLTQVQVRDWSFFKGGESSGVIINVMAYFIIGLLLISQAQYTIMRARWQIQGIPVLGPIGRRWILLVLGFLLLLGLISALLPVNYSVGIIATLSTAIQWIIWTIAQVAFVIIFLLSSIIQFLLSLLGGGSQGTEQSSAPAFPTPPAPPPTVASQPAPWWQFIRSFIFWAVLLSVVLLSLFFFVRDRWGLFQGLSLTRFFVWLHRLWQGLRRRTRAMAARVRQAIADRLAQQRARLEQRATRYLSLRRLSPRERVRYFYLSTVRRSAQLGFGRPPWMTPLEYEKILAAELPETSDQVRALTLAFLEARYSEHSIGGEDVRAVQQVWRHVKQALLLRRRRQAEAHASATPSAPTEPPAKNG